MPLHNLPAREEYKRKRRKKRFIRIGIVFFLFVLLIALLSYISHRKEIRISTVELNGGILVTQNEVEYKTLGYLRGSYLWLFPKNNTFLYSRKGLKEDLTNTFKRIDTIDIHSKGFKTLVVEITERKPFAIWCQGTPVEDNNSKCFFMDQNSTIFSEAPQFSGDAYFKYYGLLDEGSPIGKEYMASTTEFAEVSDFASRIKQMGIHPLYIMPKGEGDFTVILSGGGQIYFDIKEPLSKVADNLDALLKTPEFSKMKGNLLIEYIDMRYGNKLFYKLK